MREGGLGCGTMRHGKQDQEICYSRSYKRSLLICQQKTRPQDKVNVKCNVKHAYGNQYVRLLQGGKFSGVGDWAK